VRRRIHAHHVRRRIHACHVRRRIHACHVRRRIHACVIALECFVLTPLCQFRVAYVDKEPFEQVPFIGAH
jgi:hypothetical protein